MAWPMVSKYTVLRKFFKAVLPNWCCVNLLHRSLALLINNKTTSSVLHNTAKSATFLLSKWLSHMQKTSLSMLACGEIIIYARQIGAEHCFQRMMRPQIIRWLYSIGFSFFAHDIMKEGYARIGSFLKAILINLSKYLLTYMGVFLFVV